MTSPEHFNVDGILDALGLRPRRDAPGTDWVTNWLAGGPFPAAGPGGFPDSMAAERFVDIAIAAEGTDWVRTGKAVGGIAHLLVDAADEAPEAHPHVWSGADRLRAASPTLAGLLSLAVLMRVEPDVAREVLAVRGIEVPFA